MDAGYERWIDDRDAAAWAPHGIASLAGTHWLDAVERRFDDVPGVWHTDGEAAIGRALPTAVRLAPGEETRYGDLVLRTIHRDGAVALRVWDPDAATRRGISAIARAPHDPAHRVVGMFTSTARPAATESVDGHRSENVYDGVVSFELDGHPLELTVEVDDDGTLFAAFADATSGSESYRFRFLRLDAPDVDGRVEVDFNRAYLPPCAFSDHYVCVFPPLGNRWTVPVTSGELFAH